MINKQEPYTHEKVKIILCDFIIYILILKRRLFS